ncbi:MAG: serine hydrolase domain-containing protein [Gemmatimonadales bacterium]
MPLPNVNPAGPSARCRRGRGREFAAAIATTIVLAGTVRAQAGDLDARLDSLVPAAIAHHRVPGAVVAVVRGDRVALRGFGFARLEDSVPADPNRSLYRLASVAKLFVATVVLQQVDRAGLSLEVPIDRLAPEVPLDRRFEAPITLRHLLTHTAGFDERMIGYGAPTREAMRPLGEYLANRLPDRGWPPGMLVGYSNHGMALAAYLAEKRAGVPFAELAARDLFRPLGMTRTFYLDPPDSALRSDLARGYRCGGESGCTPAPVLWSNAYPVGLAFSTAADMARFIRVQLSGGVLDSTRIIADTMLAQAHRRQFSHHPALPGIGFAFFEQEYRGVRLLTHAGGAPGAATALVMAPETDLGVFVATNAGEPGFVKAIVHGVLDGLLPPAPIAPPIATGPVGQYAGFYRLARYSHFTVERFPAVFAFTVRAIAEGDTLVLPVGSERRRFVRVDSLLLRETTTGAPLALRRAASGEITHLYTGLPSGGAELPGAFERVPWYEAPYFLNEYASALVGLPLIVLAVWGLVAGARAWWRRRRPGVANANAVAEAARAGHDRRHQAIAIVVVVVGVAAFVTFGFGFVAAATRDLGRGQGIAYGLGGKDLVLLRLAWPIALAAVPTTVWAIVAWRRRWWSGFSRLCYSALAILAVAQAHFLIWWGYLPGRW